MTKVTAQTKEGASVEFDYDFGTEDGVPTLSQMCERFGEEVVRAQAYRSLVIASQSHARGLMKGEKTAEEIQTAMNEWKPGMPRQTTSALDKATVLLSKMSAEDRKALLAEIKSQQKAA